MNPQNWFLQFFQTRYCQYLSKVALIAIVYFVSGKIAVSIPGVKLLGSSVWPPAGIAQGFLLLFGPEYWPGVSLGAFFFDILGLKPSLTFALGAAVGSGLQAFCAVLWLRRFQFNTSFNRMIDVIKFVLIGVFFATQISCTLGAFRLAITELVPWEQYWDVRWNWWLGDSMGILIFTPLVLMSILKKPEGKQNQINHKKRIKIIFNFAILLTSLIMVSWEVFAATTDKAIARYPLEYLPFPFIIWAAIQFGHKGAVLTSFIVSSIAIWGASQGGGPFIIKAENLNQAILLLQTFMGVMTITALLLAATVTERTLAEKSLRQSEIKYRELVENANSIIVRLDQEGNITFFNEFAEKFFEYSQEEIVGKSALGTIVPKTDNAGSNLAQMMKDILDYPDRYINNENENIKRSGERVWVAWSNKPLFDTEGNFTGLLCIGTDITDRRRAEIALQQLNEELEKRVEERTNALQETLSKLQEQQDKSEKLLLNILPEAIADRLKEDESTIADTFTNVTILFADIVGFTPLSARLSPSRVVYVLNDIFSAFDQLAEKHGLEKIKTIGDAYMVVGGLPTPRHDHAEAIAEMALDMQEEISRLSTIHNESFSIRVGINSGPVVAGVIGIKKFIYDLWGDSVNTASRMESQGIPGCIQVTEVTYEILKDKFVLEKRGMIEVKGKGKMVTYFLKGRKKSTKLLMPMSRF